MSKKKDNSPYVYQRDKISFDMKFKDIPWTDKQIEFTKLALDKNTKVLFVKGPAGTSKTLLSVYCSLCLLRDKHVSDILLVRSAVESSDSKLGFLPGDMDEKMHVYMSPFNDKLDELIDKNSIDRLHKENRLITTAVNYVRGASWSAKAIIIDEAQNLMMKEFKTLLTRIGEFSKVFVCGDPEQSDLNGKGGAFDKLYDHFDKPRCEKEGIFCFEFTEKDILRSRLVKYFIDSFREIEKER